MLYALDQTAADLMLPMRGWASVANQALVAGGQAGTERWQATSALCEMMSRATLSHRRPSFGITETKIGNRVVQVHEEEVLATPFGTLLRFAKEGAPAQPRVLLVAPLSGPATLRVRCAFRCPSACVHITDWPPRAMSAFGAPFGSTNMSII
jgi:poly-beta-hydroxyalkanoate depolymerase